MRWALLVAVVWRTLGIGYRQIVTFLSLAVGVMLLALFLAISYGYWARFADVPERNLVVRSAHFGFLPVALADRAGQMGAREDIGEMAYRVTFPAFRGDVGFLVEAVGTPSESIFNPMGLEVGQGLEATLRGNRIGALIGEDLASNLDVRVGDAVVVTKELATVRRELSVVEGRAFAAGKREVIVGERLAKRMRGIDVGDDIRIHGASWAVVGRFATGDVHESSMMADATTLRDHMAQEGYASALVWLSEAEQAQSLIDRFGEESRTPLNGFRESDYYAMLGGMLPHLRVLQVFVAICLLVMLPVCVLHVMSVMVEGSKRDFAVLHALGFSSPSIFVATLLQVVMLASVAIVVAIGAALTVLDGSAFSVGVDFQTIEIEVRVGMETALYGALFGFLATALGCFWPAWKASRQTLVASH